MFNFDLTTLIATVPALLIAFAFHEYAHALAADRLGDPTPRSQGRLTLNPLVHLDLMGTLMVLLFHFGWAKPVQTNPRYYKMNPVRGHMLVALAGPVMNFFVALVATILYGLLIIWLGDSSWYPVFSPLMSTIILLNIMLGIFNLLPIPPLDGFSVLAGILPSRWAYKLRMIEPYGFIILMVVMLTGIFGKILGPLIDVVAIPYQMLLNFMI